jgi:hypothetical protein
LRKSVRPIAALGLLLAILSGAACSNTATAPATTTTTIPTTSATITDTFTGNLTPNGGQTFSFAIAGAGTVTATLTSVGTSTAIGISVGSFTAGTNNCQVAVSNDAAVQGSVVTASSSTATAACVRVYDAAGTLTSTVPFTVTVVHP